jgi:hypothetical protein
MYSNWDVDATDLTASSIVEEDFGNIQCGPYKRAYWYKTSIENINMMIAFGEMEPMRSKKI